MGPQEWNLMLWSIVLVYVEVRTQQVLLFGVAPSLFVGVVVKINLVFFCAAPLESIQRFLSTRTSDSLHLPTQIMTCTNTTFWSLYALDIQDRIILILNVMGLLLGASCDGSTANNNTNNDNSSGAADTLPINEIEDNGDHHSQNLFVNLE